MLSEIVEVYRPAVTSKDDVDFNAPHDSTLIELQTTLDQIVAAHKLRLGILNIPRKDISSEQEAQLGGSLILDSYWNYHATEVINRLHGPVSSDFVKSIEIPQWAATSWVFDSGSYLGGKVAINLRMTHSYIIQLRQQGFTELGQGCPSVCVSNVLITLDNKIVLGVRDGGTYPSTLHSYPAGVLEGHPFDTFGDEISEECGLEQSDLESVELIGRVHDHTLVDHTLYVFRTNTNLQFNEVVDRWENAAEKFEHSGLIGLPNCADFFVNHVIDNRYKREFMLPTPLKTAEENVGKILPPAAAACLLHFSQCDLAFSEGMGEKLGHYYVVK